MIRAVAALVAAVVLGGCAAYHQSYYVDSGAFFRSAGSYGGAGGYSSRTYASVNPVVYPYWSIDYFYFSRHYHPYSVYVGYREPLYYPYPGWALGYHGASHRHHSGGHGFGYPWHGSGHRYTRFSLGFFASRNLHPGGRRHGGHGRGHHGGHRDHPIRHIDRRLSELQHRRFEPPRRALLARRADNSRPVGSRSRPARSESGVRLRGRDDSSGVSGQASRRAQLRRGTRQGAFGENRSGHRAATRLGTADGGGRGRVIANNRVDSGGARRGRRGDPGDGRRVAGSHDQASISSRRPLIRSSPRPSNEGSRPSRPERQHSAPRRSAPRRAKPEASSRREPDSRAEPRHGSFSGGDRDASRRDRLRQRDGGRRRR